MAAPLSVSPSVKEVSLLPSWEKYTSCGKVVRIRTVEKEEYPKVLKVLEVWRNIYSVLSKDLSDASSIITLFPGLEQYRLGGSKVLVAEDSRGIAQVYARVRKGCSDELKVEELVVAPWNNTPCMHGLKDFQWVLSHPSISELVALYKIEAKDFVEYAGLSGTLAMYGVWQYAKFLEKNFVTLSPHKGTHKFYTKLGMKVKRMVFYFSLADGLPVVLLEKIRSSFPEERV